MANKLELTDIELHELYTDMIGTLQRYVDCDERGEHYKAALRVFRKIEKVGNYEPTDWSR